MKNKLSIMAALFAVAVLIGCSKEEAPIVETQQAEASGTQMLGDLHLSFDPFDDEDVPSRALRNNNFGQLTFQENDLVNVYNESLRLYDLYTFQTDGFYFDAEQNGGGDPWVDIPKYGILRGATTKEVKGYIHRSSRTYRIDVDIPRTFVYDVNAEKANIDGNGTRGYRCDLPMFGYANYSSEGSYIEISNVRYLVAILRVDLSGFSGKARFLRITNSAGKPLSGNLTACLYTDPSERKQTRLQVLDDDLTVYPDIYVDISAAPATHACIYLPVVAGLNGSLDGVKLEYSNDSSASTAVEATGWAVVGSASFADMNFAQHKRYTVTAAI